MIFKTKTIFICNYPQFLKVCFQIVIKYTRSDHSVQNNLTVERVQVKFMNLCKPRSIQVSRRSVRKTIINENYLVTNIQFFPSRKSFMPTTREAVLTFELRENQRGKLNREFVFIPRRQLIYSFRRTTNSDISFLKLMVYPTLVLGYSDDRR